MLFFETFFQCELWNFYYNRNVTGGDGDQGGPEKESLDIKVQRQFFLVKNVREKKTLFYSSGITIQSY